MEPVVPSVVVVALLLVGLCSTCAGGKKPVTELASVSSTVNRSNAELELFAATRAASPLLCCPDNSGQKVG